MRENALADWDLTTTDLKSRLTALYFGRSPESRRFRLGILVFDIATIAFFIGSSFFELSPVIIAIDAVIALVIATDLAARAYISGTPFRFFLRPTSLADLVVVATLLLPAFLDSFAFLRVLRALRLLRSYHVATDLKALSPFFRRNEATIQAAVNLLVFLFVVAAVVFVTQERRNADIQNYVDALYFTVTTLTTTGFGDIILEGTGGRLLAIFVMVIGVSLFLRLAQTIFTGGGKVQYTCPDCGLTRHDPDAVHCKHCGRTLHIETEGA
jgi:voltage-gated potassium channel